MVQQQDTFSILAGLNKMFSNFVSKSTATQTVAQKPAQTVVKGSQSQNPAGTQSLKMNDSSNDSTLYKKLMEEQYKELMKACNSPLSISDQNIHIARMENHLQILPKFLMQKLNVY